MKRRVKIALSGIVVLAMVAVPVGTHFRAKARLRDYRLKLKAEGEKLTTEELAPRPSPEELAAGKAVLAAASFLFSDYSNAPMMRFVAPGRALAASREPVLPTEESTNIWPGIERLLAANEQGVAQVRAALAQAEHGYAFDVDYSAGAQVLLPHLSRLKSVAQWLSLAAMVDLHQDRLTNACENLDALALAAAEYKGDALLISQLVRIAMSAIALSATWEGLQSPGWNEEQLRRLQARWESIDFVRQGTSALAVERTFGERAFEAGRRSYNAISTSFGASATSGLSQLAQMGKDVMENPADGIKNILHRYPGYWGWKYWQSYTDELVNDKACQAALEALRLAQNRSWGLALHDFETNLEQVRAQYPSAGKFIGYSAADYLDRYLFRIRSMEMQRSLLVCALALQRYKLKHGSFPDTLDALAPEFARNTPLDPIDGKPLHYRLNPDGTFVLYSIGENGVDDGGSTTPLPEALRQWWRARDVVWPLPATPEQVQAEFRKAIRVFNNQQALANQIRLNQRTLDQLRRRYGLAPPSPSKAN